VAGHSGTQGYSIALKRAEEASSDEMARDWSVMAATIARRSGTRSSVLDALFGLNRRTNALRTAWKVSKRGCAVTRVTAPMQWLCFLLKSGAKS
jgi:hypothetical protein